MTSGLRSFTRREIVGMGVAGVGASFLSGCKSLDVNSPSNAPPIDPILSARVTAPKGSVATGISVPFSTQDREAFLYVPPGYKPSTPIPLVLMLHGEGATSYSTLQLFQPHADAAGIALLSVDSGAATWDIFAGGVYGPDVDFINAALLATFNEVNVNPARLAIEGYSTGATYALAMGRTNGDLFSHVISFSAGGTEPYTPKGMPKFFLSQGLSDQVYDITQTGRLLSQNLISAGYSVDYVEFDGGHELPDAIVQQAIAWMAA